MGSRDRGRAFLLGVKDESGQSIYPALLFSIPNIYPSTSYNKVSRNYRSSIFQFPFGVLALMPRPHQRHSLSFDLPQEYDTIHKHSWMVNEENKTLLPQSLKRCCKCNQTLALSFYHKNRSRPDGLGAYCKPCNKRAYIEPKSEIICQRVKAYQAANPEKRKASRLRDKQKPQNRLRKTIKRRIKDILNGAQPTERFQSYIGCTPKSLKIYVESLFQEGMTWENYGIDGWHLDHIIPTNAFNHDNPSHVRWCWNYKNLRPLWGDENGQKSDSLDSGRSVRELRESDAKELHQQIGTKLESLGIATQMEYHQSLLS